MLTTSDTTTLTDTQTTGETTSPVKVCMLLLGFAPDDVRVMREATALREAGFAVTIIDLDHRPDGPRTEEIQGVKIQHIRMPQWYQSSRFKLWFLVKLATAFLRIISQLLHTPADVYHAHEEQVLIAGYLIARLKRKPLIFDAHELPLTDHSVTRWSTFHAMATWLLARLVPSCAGVITVSSPIAQEIHKLYHGPEVTLVRNVPVYRVVEKQDRVRQRLGLDQKTRIALYQGFVLPDRGFDRLIRAARFLEPDIVMVILGPGPDEYFAELKALIDSEGVAERVRFLPAVPYAELLDWTASADLGLAIFPPDYSLSIRMCLPNKFFEYLMAGLPVLSSQLDVMVEIIKAYDVGQVVSSLEPAAIAQAINTMLADPAALARMGANGKQAILNEFHWGKERVKLVQLYQEITPLARGKEKNVSA